MIILPFYYIYVGSGFKSGSGTGIGTVVHSGSGSISANAKSFGSCGSDSLFITLIKRTYLLAKDLTYIFLIKMIRTNWKPVPVMKLTENAFWTKERNKNRCVM
jgi:hypothetical protein